MKPPGLIGIAIFLLSKIPFSRSEFVSDIPDMIIPRPIMKLDYDLMRPGLVVKGKDVFIKCTYETHPVKEYLFFFNGEPLQDQNKYNITIYGDSLIIENINETHEGKYYCNIRTSQGIYRPGENFYMYLYTNTNSSEPDYQGLPSIHISLGESKTGIVSRFDNVSLICSVQPGSKLIRVMYWLQNGEKIEQYHNYGRLFYNATLFLTRIEMNQTGLYHCQAETILGDKLSNSLPLYVTNAAYHSSRATINLTLTANLGYGINPDNILEYDEVHMTCDITPNTTNFFNLTWYYNYKILPENVDNGVIYEDTKLVLKHVTKMSTGLYSCMVDSDQGLLFSGNVNIQVKDNITAIQIVSEKFRRLDIEKLCPDVWKLLQLPHIPRANLQLGNGQNLSDIVENDNIHFTCQVTPVTAKVRRIRWFLDNKELFRNEDTEIHNHPPILVFPCIKRKFAGNISCLVEIEGDTSPQSNNLTVEIREPIKEGSNKCETHTPIAIVELLHHPKFIYIDQQAVRLHCHIYPKKYDHNIKNITWFHDGQKLTPSDNTISLAKPSSGYVTMHGQSLIIHRIKETDIGNYTCQVLLEKYLVNSTPAPLLYVKDRNKIPPWKITPPPIVTTELLDNPNNMYEDDFVFFYCNVKPKTTEVRAVQWFFKDQLLDDMADEKISIRNNSLRLNRVKKNYAGDYFCQIETDGGTFISEPKSLKFQTRTKTYRTRRDTGEVNVTAKLGDPSEANNIYEKDGICFICDVVPPRTTIFQLNWYHNGKQISPNTSDSIIFEDKLLFLYNIQKDATGHYRCQVDTKKGLWESPDVYLTVKSGSRDDHQEAEKPFWERFWQRASFRSWMS